MITTYHEFAGFGGDTTGVLAVPGTVGVLAANHDETAVATHALNHPAMDHYRGDIAKADIAKFPRVDFFSASPACPPWTDARGVKRDFDNSTQGVLFDVRTGPVALDPKVARARALMEEIPRYLQAMNRRGKPVLVGMVENVVQVVKWAEFGRWRREIEAEGYRTRVIALNAMHVTGPTLGKVAQSRNRFILAYWHTMLGRDPDWDKWLRPKAYCLVCDEVVAAVQSFKDPRNIMGVYGIRHGQYVYRCPHRSCRNQIVEPAVLGAETIIDWALDPGQRIGERVDQHGRPDPLSPNTIARIEAGLARHLGAALLTPSGGTWRTNATSVHDPMPTRTTRENDALVCPPMLVPVAARAGLDTATTVSEPMRTQTCRRETAMVMPTVPPFISIQRNGGSATAAYPVDRPIPTVSAQGNHHGLVHPPTDPADLALLMAYYGTGGTHPVDRPVGTLTTRDRYALIGGTPPVQTCTFRMLEPHEVGAGMGFPRDYKMATTSKRKKVRGFGNAVPPAMAEVVSSALIETITGEPLDPAA